MDVLEVLYLLRGRKEIMTKILWLSTLLIEQKNDIRNFKDAEFFPIIKFSERLTAYIFCYL